MKFENTEVWGFKHALRGMRNPKESWNKSDSCIRNTSWDMCSWSGVKIYSDEDKEIKFIVGENDLKLAQTLIKAGSEHRKFLRQIFISVDITAPLYWWKEAQRYHWFDFVSSQSTMHCLMKFDVSTQVVEETDPRIIAIIIPKKTFFIMHFC